MGILFATIVGIIVGALARLFPIGHARGSAAQTVLLCAGGAIATYALAAMTLGEHAARVPGLVAAAGGAVVALVAHRASARRAWGP